MGSNLTPAPAGFPAQGGAAPRPTDEISYAVVSGQEYGARWRSMRPPGLPASARRASARGAALPHVEELARGENLHGDFVLAVRHLCYTESTGRFGLPANIFDARPPDQRPPGKALITAWGAFQFNRDAWRALPGVSPSAFPWNSTPREELARPIARYARLFRAVIGVGGESRDGARGIRLWHISPAAFQSYSREGSRMGFAAAWAKVEPKMRAWIDARLREGGVGT